MWGNLSLQGDCAVGLKADLQRHKFRNSFWRRCNG
jgi:hypothetical protein